MMSHTESRNDDQKLVDGLDELGDSIVLDDVEAKRIVRAAGMDVAKGLQKALALVEAAKGLALQNALRTARDERLSMLKRFEGGRSVRSRAESISFIHKAGQSLPPASRPQAFHRSFETATDEDIESLAAEIEVLLAMENEK
nr:hypothetical protein MFMH1_47960 [Myxococcus sp. MH1]